MWEYLPLSALLVLHLPWVNHNKHLILFNKLLFLYNKLLILFNKFLFLFIKFLYLYIKFLFLFIKFLFLLNKNLELLHLTHRRSSSSNKDSKVWRNSRRRSRRRTRTSSICQMTSDGLASGSWRATSRPTT